jgi:hypothetical protein
VRADDLRAGDDFVALMRRAEAALPVVTREGGLRQGAVATTDPAVAHEVLALLLVAPTQAAALAALATAAPRAAARLAAALGRQTAPQA